ncbi:hypothetical protein [Telluribacter sp. SYSU D00476]|uniref:hypothetical protein n=1 Tax=Telluribacter sp. SYSU D00476 TaxID=2811430 RepID=UPI001FF2B015|nr:hypothetical protein [Telluribacter sp. SYSU D00476]
MLVRIGGASELSSHTYLNEVKHTKAITTKAIVELVVQETRSTLIFPSSFEALKIQIQVIGSAGSEYYYRASVLYKARNLITGMVKEQRCFILSQTGSITDTYLCSGDGAE